MSRLRARGLAGRIVAPVGVLGTPQLDRIPAEPPIGGPIWTVVIPVLLFATTFVATWLLYRRFSRGDG